MTSRRSSGTMLLVFLLSTMTLASSIQKVQGQGPVPVISSLAPDPVNSDFEVIIDFDATVDASVFPLLNYSNCDWNNPQSVSGDDSIWTLQITPTTDGEVTVQAPAGIYQDSALNWNSESNLLRRTYDSQGPVPVISSLAPDPVNSGFEITIDFDKTVSPFVFPLLNYSNCDWSNPQSVSGDDSVWTLQISPVVDGEVMVQVPAGIYQDDALNWNLESNLFSRTYAPHDIAITNVIPSKTVVGQGFSLNVNVTAANQGDYTESFNVTVYANTTIIETKTNITLTSGNTTNITFIWNTTGFAKGNYTIKAVANPLLGETDTDDNTRTDGWVIVAMVGDISSDIPGVPDGKVDMVDMYEVAKRFGLNYPDPRFVANFDVDGDNKIDMVDMWIVSKEFGKIDP